MYKISTGNHNGKNGSENKIAKKQKTEKKKKKRERERERKLVITMAKLRMVHASTHGARKPPGPIINFWVVILFSLPFLPLWFQVLIFYVV